MKRIFILLLTILLVLGCQAPSFVLADSTFDVNYGYYETSLPDKDLDGLKINNIEFNKNLYVKDNSKDLEVITMLEVGYDTQYYSCYIYLYNPTNVEYDYTASDNNVQMGYFDKAGMLSHENLVADDNLKITGYKKVKITYVNNSNNTIFKFKIELNKDDINEVNGVRHYYISSLELTYDNKLNDIKVAKDYLYTGSPRKTLNEESTLRASEQDFEVLALDLNYTYYRTGGSSLGKYHQNQLTSLYFSIPNSILKKYGNLTGISAEWWEYKTAPIVVTSDTEMYDYFIENKVIGKSHSYNKYIQYDTKLERGYEFFDYHNRYEFGFGTESDYYANGDIVENYVGLYNNAFSLPLIRNFDGWGKWNDEVVRFDNYIGDGNLYYLFSTLGYDASTFTLTGDELETYITKTFDTLCSTVSTNRLPVKNGTIAQELVVGADAGRTAGYNNVYFTLEDVIDMPGYNETHSFWDTVSDFGLWETVTKQTPQDLGIETNVIQEVKQEDLKNLAGLYVNVNDRNIFSTFCTNSFLGTNGEKSTPFLLRIGANDFYSAPIYTFKNGWRRGIQGYVAQETVFLNCDILYLGFGNDVVNKSMPKFTIANASDPIDIYPSVEPPRDDSDNFDLKRFLIILAICIIMVIIFVLLVIGFIYNPILTINIIVFPFKLIYLIFKGIVILFKKILKKE